VEARNHADGLVHSTEKTLAEHGDKIDAGEKQAIETAVAELKTAMEGDDADAIKAKTDALAQVAMKLGEAMYKAQAGGDDGAGPGAGPGAGAGDAGSGAAGEGVVDADFEEVDEGRRDKSA